LVRQRFKTSCCAILQAPRPSPRSGARRSTQAARLVSSCSDSLCKTSSEIVSRLKTGFVHHGAYRGPAGPGGSRVYASAASRWGVGGLGMPARISRAGSSLRTRGGQPPRPPVDCDVVRQERQAHHAHGIPKQVAGVAEPSEHTRTSYQKLQTRLPVSPLNLVGIKAGTRQENIRNRGLGRPAWSVWGTHPQLMS